MVKEIMEDLIFTKGLNGTEYWFEVGGCYFGPYKYASIALINKIKEEGKILFS